MATVERKVLQEHYCSLYSGLKHSVDDILPLMKRHSLLPKTVMMNVTNPGMLMSDKLTLILSALETQIEMDRQAFHTFLDEVLAKNSHLSNLYHQMSFSYRFILRSREKKSVDEPVTNYEWTAPVDQSEHPTSSCSKSELETNSDTFKDRDSGISSQHSGLQEYIDASSQITALKDQVGMNNSQPTVPVSSSLCSINSLPVKVTSSRPSDLPMTDKDLLSPLGSSAVHSNPANLSIRGVPSTPFSKEETRNHLDADPESLSSQSSVTSSCMGCDDMQARIKEMEREMAKMSLKLSQQESVIAVDDQHYLKKVDEIQKLKDKLTEKQREKRKLKKDLKEMQAKYKQLEGQYHLAMVKVMEVECLKRKLERTEREKAILWEEFLKKCNDSATFGCSKKECMQHKQQMNLTIFKEREENQELRKKVQALTSRLQELENALHHCQSS